MGGKIPEMIVMIEDIHWKLGVVVPPEEKFMLSLLRWFGHVQQKLVNALWFFILSIII